MSEQAQSAKKGMEKALEHLRSSFSRMRVGRATTSMVEDVKVEAYGSRMTLKEVAALSIPDAKTIAIQPWDKGVIADVEKGILAANLGLTPINDGKLIRINLPPLTEERRKEFVKEIKKEGEEVKIEVRNIRRECMDGLRQAGKASEDEQRRTQDEIQKLTDHYVQEIDKIVDTKSKEVMTL